MHHDLDIIVSGENALPTELLSDPARVLNVEQAATFIGATKGWLDQDRVSGKSGLPHVRLGEGRGARVGYRLSDLRTWLAGRVRHSTSDRGVAA